MPIKTKGLGYKINYSIYSYIYTTDQCYLLKNKIIIINTKFKSQYVHFSTRK